MLHELLLALSGFPGSVFVEDARTGIVKVVGDLPFIHVSETELLNRLCQLATHYIKFEKFLRLHSHVPLAGNSQETPVCGAYVRSFAQGLDDVLQDYRQALLDIESSLLADPHLTAASVQTSLEEYQLLFPALLSLIEQISDNKIHGCSLLELVYKAASEAIPVIQAALERILTVCHTVFFKQLSCWLLHGSLQDKYEEFFITRVSQSTAASSSTAADVSSSSEDLDISGVMGRQLSMIMKLSEAQDATSNAGSFTVSGQLLPSYIMLPTAEKILFVGEAVHMFSSHRQTDNSSSDAGSLLNGREDEFSRDLYNLSQRPIFDVIAFEDLVDKIRSCVAEQLWSLVVENADFLSQLRIVKDFYLLGRGELFLAFIDQANSMLCVPISQTTERDVNAAFQQAARNILLENDSLLQHFTLELKTSHDAERLRQRSSVGVKENGWDCLRLKYLADWPLHVLFTTSVLDRYNSLFTFLLHVRRVQLRLQQCWALAMNRRHLCCATDRPSSTKWWLRNHMAFVIDNLQYYLQVDVIESQFSVMIVKMQATRDFEAIRLAHDQFLSALGSHCFFHLKPVSHCLGEILDLCQSFCGLISHSETVLSAQESARLEDIATSFQRQSSLLFEVLSNVRSHHSSPELAQLLLRIDYNRFFSVTYGRSYSRSLMQVHRT